MRIPAFLRVLGVFLAFVTFTAVSARADWPLDKMNEQIEKTNVIVGGNCSGTIISVEKRLVLTAEHCIQGQFVEKKVKEVDPKTGVVTEKTIQEKLPLGITIRKVANFEIVGVESHLVKIVGSDRNTDIAILQVVDADFKPKMAAKLAGDDYLYQRGSKVYAVGNPGVEFDNSITEGIISAPQRTVDFGTGVKLKMFQHSATVIGGNSGGAILNEDGELIGTVTGGLRGAAISFAAPISLTKALLVSSGFSDVAKGKP